MHKTTDNAIICLQNVKYSHPDRMGVKSENTLKGINLNIFEGDTVSIIGPSGCGKSTLLRILNRLIDPDNGEVYFTGKPLKDFAVLDLRMRVLLVPQEPYTGQKTIADNLKLARVNSELTDKEMSNVLVSVGLGNKDLLLDSSRLSVGEKHRLGLARAFLLQPHVLLLDEPAASLDLPAAKAVIDTVKSLHKKFNNTIVMVTHRFHLARRLGGTVVMMMDGRIIETGPAGEFFENPQNEETRKFIQSESEDQ